MMHDGKMRSRWVKILNPDLHIPPGVLLSDSQVAARVREFKGHPGQLDLGWE